MIDYENTGMAAIVSNDMGFQAVRDYWKNCSSKSRNIILRPDIERCIHSSGEYSIRQRKISIEKKELNLEEEYKKSLQLHFKVMEQFGQV